MNKYDDVPTWVEAGITFYKRYTLLIGIVIGLLVKPLVFFVLFGLYLIIWLIWMAL